MGPTGRRAREGISVNAPSCGCNKSAHGRRSTETPLAPAGLRWGLPAQGWERVQQMLRQKQECRPLAGSTSLPINCSLLAWGLL